MRIEKINENQLKVILNHSDLAERNIDLIELVSGSDKTHSFIMEMMEIALSEYDFKPANAPIIVEAAPLSVDSFMLIITKVSGDAADAKRAGGGETRIDIISEISKYVQSKKQFTKPQKPYQPAKQPERHTIFFFNGLDDAIKACSRLRGVFEGKSLLAKLDGRYYLFLHNTQISARPQIARLDACLSEYGAKFRANLLFEHYLREHGEVIISEYATVKLGEYLCEKP